MRQLAGCVEEAEQHSERAQEHRKQFETLLDIFVLQHRTTLRPMAEVET
jgi:hypothetical protein